MDKRYITFYKKFILQTKTLNDGGVISNGAFIPQKITIEFTLVHRTKKLYKLSRSYILLSYL